MTLDKAADHRLSYIFGHTTPPVDVNWFTGRTADSSTRIEAYLDVNGNLQDSIYGPLGDELNPVRFNTVHGGALHAKWFHWWSQPGGSVTNHDDKHYLFDLYVNFEFIMPDTIMKKISGFRVVRAERTENDRRIIQQGILNQTIMYGNASGGLDSGYDTDFDWSRKDNENLDDDPIFTNDYDVGSPSLPVQPEYDTYLNGYMGSAENNHLAWYDDSISDGKLTSGDTVGKIYAFKENEDGRRLASTSSWPWRKGNTPTINAYIPGEHPGPGATLGRYHGHSAFFGSYEKTQNNNDYVNTSIARANSAAHVSGSIFTLDSPDSAFGTRPYVFKEGDLLRIDSVMKLSDERRYVNMGGAYTTHPSGYESLGLRYTTDSNPSAWFSTDFSGNITTDYTEDEATTLSSKRQLDKDKDYGMLLGKYYIYDTYWGIGMETDGGQTYAKQHEPVNNMTDTAKPTEDYRYFAEIGVAKEIGNGEIVPSGFFKSSYQMTSGTAHGFSNHTLGVVSDKGSWNAKWGGPRHILGSAAPVTMINSGELTTEDDLDYNTMSSIQMGLRSIVLEVHNTSGYNFNPRDLTTILSNQSWLPRNDSSGVNAGLYDLNPMGHLQKISTGNAH